MPKQNATILKRFTKQKDLLSSNFTIYIIYYENNNFTKNEFVKI